MAEYYSGPLLLWIFFSITQFNHIRMFIFLIAGHYFPLLLPFLLPRPREINPSRYPPGKSANPAPPSRSTVVQCGVLPQYVPTAGSRGLGATTVGQHSAVSCAGSVGRLLLVCVERAFLLEHHLCKLLCFILYLNVLSV